MVGVARAVRRRLRPAAARLARRLHPQGRVRHDALHAARAGPQHRGRLGRAARPGLRRVLRHRRVRLRDAELAPVRHPPADRGHGSLDGGDRSHRRLPRRTSVAPPDRRLPRDRDPVLSADNPDRARERRPDRRPRPHGRRQRDHQRRPLPHLRPRPRGPARRRVRGHLPVHRDRLLRGRVRRAALPQPLPHRSRLALAARGLAGRRGDGHAREPAQAHGVQLRRSHRSVSRERSSLPCRRASSRSRSRSRS